MAKTDTSHRADFDPGSKEALAAAEAHGERRGGRYAPYVYEGDLRLAVRIALATDRPLLLRGPPGCGKSTVAEDVAVRLRRRYYEHVVSSRTEARDLLWRFDAVRRLGDAHATGGLAAAGAYVEPGALWWAFEPESAARRGLPDPERWAPDPTGVPAAPGAGAVVLIDEIDKADPDFPNDLLVPLGSKHFRVGEIDLPVSSKRETLIVVTTNEERDLPQAFLRRCIVHVLPRPEEDHLRKIVAAHFPAAGEALVTAVLAELQKITDEASGAGLRAPGTAELLDTVRACIELGVTSTSKEWGTVTRATLWKHGAVEKR
jgi:MoxR-like ATPase